MTLDFAAAIAQGTGADGVTGASFAYWDGARLHAEVGGLRNSVTGDPVTLDTLMHIGSITKVLNAALFMQLVDDGLIDLDDPVSKHLPQLKLGDMNALGTMTCRMLINHTNGIDFECPEYEDFDRQRIEDAIAQTASKAQLHPPGEATAYSNIGTAIAGYMAQTLRGEGWYSLIKTRLFEPLGLRHSLADITEIPRFRVSVGDQVDAEGRRVQSTRPFLPLSFGPAGATIMMTAADLVMFTRALINDGVGVNGERILSAESAAAMAIETAIFAAPPTSRVGLGWFILPGGVLHHAGGGPGVASTLYAHPESGRAFALLTNCAKHGFFGPTIVDPILESWGALVAPATPLSGIGDAVAYEGIYENQMFRYEVFHRDDGLFARTGMKLALYESEAVMSPPIKLERIADHVFQIITSEGAKPVPLAFISPDSSGKMQRLATMSRILNRVA